MSTNAGNLLWNRKRFTVSSAAPVDIDTGLRQTNQSFEASSVAEPNLGIPGLAPPLPGTEPPSRVQVVPLAPTANWAGVTHSEPWVNTATGTVFVTFTFTVEDGPTAETELNALFWDPHTLIGPGQADTYNRPNIQ